MRELTPEELEELKPRGLSDEDLREWLKSSPTWCVVCKKFIDHYIDRWGNPGPAFSANLEVSGHYCAYHSYEELENVRKAAQRTLDS